jgi:hypothetical protein
LLINIHPPDMYYPRERVWGAGWGMGQWSGSPSSCFLPCFSRSVPWLGSVFLIPEKQETSLNYILCPPCREIIVLQLYLLRFSFFSLNIFWPFQMKSLGFLIFLYRNWPQKPILCFLIFIWVFYFLQRNEGLGLNRWKQQEMAEVKVITSARGGCFWRAEVSHQATSYALTNLKMKKLQNT